MNVRHHLSLSIAVWLLLPGAGFGKEVSSPVRQNGGGQEGAMAPPFGTVCHFPRSDRQGKVCWSRRKTCTSGLLSLVAMLALVFGMGVTVQAAKLYVANNGLDSATCGDKNTPCRSISRAIANANTDDKIIVGPGCYGDLNGDGTIGNSHGEENPAGGAISCSCLIRVQKRLSFESRDGTGATVLDARGIGVNVVRIEASGVAFGKKNKGFTLAYAGFSGLLIPVGSTAGVRITSNLAIANSGEGFDFDGSG